jgi:alkylated DNA repair protein alkB family protein 7
VKGHYDSVIHDYRETLLSSLPPSPAPTLTTLLTSLYSLLTSLTVDPESLPPPESSTHLLHLSPKGAILPHVDNLEASGSVILGLSLGAERTMRLKKKDGEGGWELRLPSGSVYLQR